MRIFEMSQRHRTPSIRMINLVDVLLNLLIFFIASTTFRLAKKEQTGVKVTLPDARTAEEVGKTEVPRLRIVVAPDNRLYLDNNPVTLDVLERELKRAHAKNPNTLLELSADKTANYGTVVAIVDAARAAGLRDITAFTKRSVTAVHPSSSAK
jgi:biopolymer transport protein ExbD